MIVIKLGELRYREGGSVMDEDISIHAVRVLARLAAKRAVEAELRAKGIRVTLVPPREIKEQADVYLSQHPELIDQAKERARLMGLFERKPKPKRPKPRMYVTPDPPSSS